MSLQESKGLTLVYLLDSLQLNPIAVSDTNNMYIKEYKTIYDDYRFNFDFSKLSDGNWMLISSAYGKPRYVIQIKNGKKHGYEIMADEKSGYVRAITDYFEGKKNGQSTSYSMDGVKDGLIFYSNDYIVDTQYFFYPNGSIQKKLFESDSMFRILEFNNKNQLIEERHQYGDSNIIYNYVNGKLRLRIKSDARKTILMHFDSNGTVLEIDTNRIN